MVAGWQPGVGGGCGSNSRKESRETQRGEYMPPKEYKKGPKLFSLARKKALLLDVPQEKGVKLAELICRIQLKEGNRPCFGQQGVCTHNNCCWQGSCGARME
jgi:hypothetical protein